MAWVRTWLVLTWCVPTRVVSQVCEKVEQKVRTTYNEVADELVAEFAGSPDMSEMNEPGFGSDDKNRKSAGGEAGIRRRVYDALNVLMAMDIITKEKKNILWRGLPTNTEQEGARLQMDLNSRTERMDRKRQHLHDLVAQQVSFKQLISRNRASTDDQSLSKIALPFIVVNTRKETVIDCEMAEDRQEIFFNFSVSPPLPHPPIPVMPMPCSHHPTLSMTGAI